LEQPHFCSFVRLVTKIGYSDFVVENVYSLNTSTLRYYEEVGLIPCPDRKGGKRIYQASVIGRLEFIKLAQCAGYQIDEIKVLLDGFDSNIPPSERWRAMAIKKQQELNEKQNQLRLMQSVLQDSLHCSCLSWDECFHTIQSSKPQQGG
jgi:MerR family transcriptional regulator, redox-sensitive transcriptional activator SoxR